MIITKKVLFKTSLLLAITCVLMTGCSSNKSASTIENATKKNTSIQQPQNSNSNSTPVESPAPTTDPDKELKEKAVLADFVAINGHYEDVKGQKVYAEGTISIVDYKRVMDIFPSFTLTTKEGSGYGMYHIVNILNIPDLKDNDMVKIYGTITKPEEKTQMPTITATIIEKVK